MKMADKILMGMAKAVLDCNENGVCPLKCEHRTGLSCTIPEIDILDVASDLLESRAQNAELIAALENAATQIESLALTFQSHGHLGSCDRALLCAFDARAAIAKNRG